MSQPVVEQVIGRMILDQEFRKQVAADPDSALKGYDLTEGEREGLRNIDPQDLDQTVTGLDTRVSKGFQAN